MCCDICFEGVYMNRLILVNKDNILTKTYIPRDLIIDPKSGKELNKDTYKAFTNMNKAMDNQGLSKLVLVSAYRPYDYQEKVFTRKVNGLMKEGLSKTDAIDKAKTIVALPGTSEHQTGLAIDITNQDLNKQKDPLIEEFENTIHAKWLRDNAHKYGFILRYPKGKTNITHISYEPWHYRYVGIYHANEIKKRGMCLEEYISHIDKKQ